MIDIKDLLIIAAICITIITVYMMIVFKVF